MRYSLTRILCTLPFVWGAIAVVAIGAPSANAQEDCSVKSGASYCYCIYNNALEALRSRTGTDSVSISERIEIAAKALKRCLTRSTGELEDGIDQVN